MDTTRPHRSVDYISHLSNIDVCHSQILGGALLAIGIIAELQKEDYGDVSSSVLASPAIICIIIGSVLFLLGLLGAVGALVELYYVLMIVSGYDNLTTVHIIVFISCSMCSYFLSYCWLKLVLLCLFMSKMMRYV